MPVVSKFSKSRKAVLVPVAGAVATLGGLGCFVSPASRLAAAPLVEAARASAQPGSQVPPAASSSAVGIGAACGIALAAAAGSASNRRARGRAACNAASASSSGNWSHCSEYKEEMLATVKAMTQPGKGILAMDESNGTCGLRLQSIGVDNTEENRQRWRTALLGTKGLGDFSAAPSSSRRRCIRTPRTARRWWTWPRRTA